MTVLLGDAERARVVAGLHVLLSRVHLREAGVRNLTAQEEYTLYLVDQWYTKRGGHQQMEIPGVADNPSGGYLCKCMNLDGSCPHKHYKSPIAGESSSSQ